MGPTQYGGYQYIYTAAAPGTPITATEIDSGPFSEIDMGGIWSELLSLSATGIEVTTSLGGGDRHRVEHVKHPPSLQNSTANPKIFGALVSTDKGEVFAVVSTNDRKYSIESWRIADANLTAWNFTGTVDIGSAWD